MILVTGASGKLGQIIVHELQLAGVFPRLMVRDKQKVSKHKDLQIIEGDYRNLDSLQAAFKGVERAFIVSLHERPMERANLHRNAFVAAAAAGVKYIVYTSFQVAAQESSFNMARDHYITEKYLQESGLNYTALRNNFYMETAHEEVNKDGNRLVIRNPAGDGRVAWVCRNDIAQVAAHLLINPMIESKELDVTGPEAPKLSELTQLLSDLSGKNIEFEQESYEEGLTWRSKSNLVNWNLEAWMSSDIAKGKGEVSKVSNTVEKVLGRKASASQFCNE